MKQRELSPTQYYRKRKVWVKRGVWSVQSSLMVNARRKEHFTLALNAGMVYRPSLFHSSPVVKLETSGSGCSFYIFLVAPFIK